MARILSTRTLSRAGAAFLLAGVLSACGAATPSTLTATQQPVAIAPTVAPTTAPTVAPTTAPTTAPTVAPTAEPPSALFTSESKLPVQLEYPAGWAVSDFGKRDAADHVGLPEQSMEIVAPDSDAKLIVRYYDYKEPGSGDVTGAYVAIQFNESIDRTTVEETSDSNGTMNAEWTYTDAETDKPTRAILRFIHNEGSPYTFALLFQAPEEQFAELAPVGQAMIDSFQER